MHAHTYLSMYEKLPNKVRLIKKMVTNWVSDNGNRIHVLLRDGILQLERIEAMPV